MLETEWSKVNGAMTVEWDGEQKTPSQLLPFLESTNRAVRERAFRLRAKPYIERRWMLAGIFDRMYDLRHQSARNAGFANYRAFAHLAKNRFHYTPAAPPRFPHPAQPASLPA